MRGRIGSNMERAHASPFRSARVATHPWPLYPMDVDNVRFSCAVCTIAKDRIGSGKDARSTLGNGGLSLSLLQTCHSAIGQLRKFKLPYPAPAGTCTPEPSTP